MDKQELANYWIHEVRDYKDDVTEIIHTAKTDISNLIQTIEQQQEDTQQLILEKECQTMNYESELSELRRKLKAKDTEIERLNEENKKLEKENHMHRIW